MPIKPENKSRYPANWPDIRRRVLDRAKNRCEKCSAANGTIIARGKGKDQGTYITEGANVFDDNTGEFLGRWKTSEYDAGKPIKVVLTIAHLDHVPENCDMGNLRAWCQKCHLQYDAGHHAETARKTRKARKAIGDLF